MIKNKIQIPIIYEDDHVLVLNKPAGISVHPAAGHRVHGNGKTKEYTVADWILKKYPNLVSVGEPQGREGDIPRPGIVHRLDKETSGVLVVAKDQPTYVFLKKQFAGRTVAKTYRAFAYGTLKKERGIINKPIGRSAGAFAGRATGERARGELREAVTVYKVIRTGSDKKGKEKAGPVSYLELFPKTGRTHQIRVHLASVQHPIIGDMLYAPKRTPALGFKRLALHACSIEIDMPYKGGRKLFTAVLPKDFKNAERIIAKDS
ncbi:MAG: RluA family pseudouridine synthase [Patescibacteria group bacterium]